MRKVLFFFGIACMMAASCRNNSGQVTMVMETTMGDIEFRLEEGIYHKRGVIGAAREGDDVNPEQASCASQFYFVWGKVFDDAGLDKTQERIDRETGGRIKLTPEMREYYKTYGGTPHLDVQYTVFGEITEGLEVVEAIQKVETDENDRPLVDVRILKVYRK